MNQLRFIFIVAILSTFTSLSAQINYQAVIRGADNLPMEYSGPVDVELLQDGISIYSESHEVNTGDLGIVNIAIGTGTNPSTDFNEIDWSLNNYEIILTINNETLPATPIRAVPIAEYAKHSSNSYWAWDSANEVLSFTGGKVGINTSEVGNSHLKISGEPGNFPLSIVQGAEGANSGVILFSPNSNNTGRIFMNNDIMNLGRGANPQILSIANSGKIGINETNPASSLHVNGLSTLTNQSSSTLLKLRSATSNLDTWIASYNENNAREWLINMCDRSLDDRFGIYSQDYNGYLLSISHSGQTSVKCLQIEGGCDLKEDFNSTEFLEAGDVVILDENNPGQLIRSSTSYDKKVAGVISGANGINPGLTLSQDGYSEGEFPLAMVGQVYVKATGKIEVGDMLTTSSIPGFAMAVTNFDKANGSVIGKAMSTLDGGEGFVLLLVNLQ